MSSAPVDWRLAAATANRLVRPGPDIGHAEAAQVVSSLRTAATRAVDLVAETTGLPVSGTPAPVLVVDRRRWVGATIESFSVLLGPMTDAIVARSGSSLLGSKATGLEVGVLMALLSSRVLGQYDPYHDNGTGLGRGRLLLIAPNIVAAERELGVTPADFRLWVALHEQTHVVQFTHRPGDEQPWLRDHLRSLIEQLVEVTDLDTAALVSAVRGVAAKVRDGHGDDVSVLDLVREPEQRELLDRITAVMSLLEGHADVIMDEVGPRVIPSVAAIRARFDQRRARTGRDTVVRRLMGLDVKLRQYAEGAAFCRRVLRRTGMGTLNRAFADAEHLPTLTEIRRPDRWLDRVGG